MDPLLEQAGGQLRLAHAVDILEPRELLADSSSLIPRLFQLRLGASKLIPDRQCLCRGFLQPRARRLNFVPHRLGLGLCVFDLAALLLQLLGHPRGLSPLVVQQP